MIRVIERTVEAIGDARPNNGGKTHKNVDIQTLGNGVDVRAVTLEKYFPSGNPRSRLKAKMVREVACRAVLKKV